jgi:hypothetical protein
VDSRLDLAHGLRRGRPGVSDSTERRQPDQNETAESQGEADPPGARPLVRPAQAGGHGPDECASGLGTLRDQRPFEIVGRFPE